MLHKLDVLEIIRAVLEEQFEISKPRLEVFKLTGFCAIASALGETLGFGRAAHGQVWLEKHLRRPGQSFSQHCWIVAGDEIIDLTATQFDGPKVCIFPIGEKQVWGEYIETYKPDFEEWPEWQQPKPELIESLRQEVLRRTASRHSELNPSLWC
jgi:hypothetical protein